MSECSECGTEIGDTIILGCAHMNGYSARKIVGRVSKQLVVYTFYKNTSSIEGFGFNRILYVGKDRSEADRFFIEAQERVIYEGT